MQMPMDVGHSTPTIYGLNNIELPDVASWEVGSVHYIVAKVTVVNKSASNPEGEAGRTIISADLNIRSVRSLTTQTKTPAEYENEEFSKAKAEAYSNGQ